MDVPTAMAAELIPSNDGERPHSIKLPAWSKAGDVVEEVRNALILDPGLRGPVDLFCDRWPLRVVDVQRLRDLLASTALSLRTVYSLEDGACIAAASMGWAVVRPVVGEKAPSAEATPMAGLSIHQGTLRSGDHQHAAGSLLVLGDVNPGAQISAAGHVMVWGRLRGIAHAGRSGDRSATIVALQLHPLQLRIADLVARGPAEAPPPGLAEKAHLVGGAIQIDPADPFWPLGGVPAQGLGQS
jgi:septum site-determining protein MinC